MESIIIEYAVGFLLDKVVEETKNVIYCKDYCHTLGELLKSVGPLVSAAYDKLSGENSASTSGVVQKGALPADKWWTDVVQKFSCCLKSSDEPVTETRDSSEPHPVRRWLRGLNEVVMEGEKAVSECNDASVLERRGLAKKLLEITQKIKDICTTQATLATLNVTAEVKEGIDKIDQKINELRETLDEIKLQGCETQQTLVQVNETVEKIYLKMDVPAAASNELYSDRQEPMRIFGMDDKLKELQGLLCGGNSKWVGIYGIGGMGKTLLATRAHNSPVVQAHFEKHIYWLTVARKTTDKELPELLQRLCDKLNISYHKADPVDELKQNLINALCQKRVLLIFDDVWNDGVGVLKSLDVTTDGTGSKMLVTTREIEVVYGRSAESNIAEININRLSEDDSLKLFCQHAWGGVEKIPSELSKELVKAVADECKGLPLALEVIARSQASPQAGQPLDVRWNRTLKTLKEAAKILNSDVEKQLYARLKISYDALKDVDPRLQKCFLYFAAFPEDSNVYSEELVNLWAGEKMFEDSRNSEDDPLEEGYYLLDQLIRRSLIELRKTKLPKYPKYRNRLQLTCRVHDVLRDFGLYLIKEEIGAPMDCLFSPGTGLDRFPDKWLRQSGGPGVATSRATHISLSHNQLKSLPAELEAPRLEVLLLNKNSERRGKDPPLLISPGFLESFSSLKVLDLHDTQIESLPDTVGKLTNLIYLDLSESGLRRVPVQLEKLTKLEFLSLRGCKKIEPWPFDISCLKLLSILDTTDCSHIWKPQSGLQEYEDASPNLPSQVPSSLEGLCTLTALQTLSIEGVQEDLPPQFSALVNLCYLKIKFRHIKRFPSTLWSRSEPYPSKLQYLDLSCCDDLIELPSWVDSLSQLSHLYLCACGALAYLPNLDQLKKLRILNLHGCESLQELPPRFARKAAFPTLEELQMGGCIQLQKFPLIEDGAFSHLKTLSLNGCKSLLELPDSFSAKGAFPALEELDMGGCKKLRTFPPVEDGSFSHLKTLSLNSCKNLLELPAGFAAKGAFQALEDLLMEGCNKLKNLPPIEDEAFLHLQTFWLSGCESLLELPNGFSAKGAFPALEELDMEGCKKLRSFPPIEDGAFLHLETLSLNQCQSLLELPVGFSAKGAFPALKELKISGASVIRGLPYHLRRFDLQTPYFKSAKKIFYP